MYRHSSKRLHYILFFKPYGVLCQFTKEPNSDKTTLADYGHFPKDVYPAGRLDADSEGLVFLTNDGRLKHLLIEPAYKHPRTYFVQVEGVPATDALERLAKGVIIDKKKTLPAKIELIKNEPYIPPRPVPVRFRKSVPTSWLSITLYEGRNRQVRKMTAVVGFPTLRLVRVSIGNLLLEGLSPGKQRALSDKEIEDLKKIIAPISKDRKTSGL